MRKMRNFLINKNDKLYVLLEKLTVTDSYVLEIKNLKRETCDFVAKSVAGLKVNAQAKHTKQSKLKCKYVILLVKAMNYYQHIMQIPVHHISEPDVLNSVSANLLYWEESLDKTCI